MAMDSSHIVLLQHDSRLELVYVAKTLQPEVFTHTTLPGCSCVQVYEDPHNRFSKIVEALASLALPTWSGAIAAPSGWYLLSIAATKRIVEAALRDDLEGGGRKLRHPDDDCGVAWVDVHACKLAPFLCRSHQTYALLQSRAIKNTSDYDPVSVSLLHCRRGSCCSHASTATSPDGETEMFPNIPPV